MRRRAWRPRSRRDAARRLPAVRRVATRPDTPRTGERTRAIPAARSISARTSRPDGVSTPYVSAPAAPQPRKIVRQSSRMLDLIPLGPSSRPRTVRRANQFSDLRLTDGDTPHAAAKTTKGAAYGGAVKGSLCLSRAFHALPPAGPRNPATRELTAHQDVRRCAYFLTTWRQLAPTG